MRTAERVLDLKDKAWFWPTLLAGASIDQFTKLLAARHIGERTIDIIPYVLGLVYNDNPGGLFGMMAGAGTILAVLSIFAIVFIVWLLHRSPADGVWTPVAFGMLASGAYGNLIDRAFNGGKVRDFILLHVGSYHWPAFNVADALICIGCGMLIWSAMTEKKRRK